MIWKPSERSIPHLQLGRNILTENPSKLLQTLLMLLIYGELEWSLKILLQIRAQNLEGEEKMTNQEQGKKSQFHIFLHSAKHQSLWLSLLAYVPGNHLKGSWNVLQKFSTTCVFRILAVHLVLYIDSFDVWVRWITKKAQFRFPRSRSSQLCSWRHFKTANEKSLSLTKHGDAAMFLSFSWPWFVASYCLDCGAGNTITSWTHSGRWLTFPNYSVVC